MLRQVKSIASYNHLGNNDGRNLSDPLQAAALLRLIVPYCDPLQASALLCLVAPYCALLHFIATPPGSRLVAPYCTLLHFIATPSRQPPSCALLRLIAP